jgi:CelD/BcsL family acetyltransferase involved in cellulose biosynthesis
VLRWSREGLVRFLTLRHAGRVIACRLAFERNRTLYLYYSGFEPEYAPYSVMTRTVAEGLRWAARRGVRSVNLSTGEDVSKTRWRPLRLPYELVWQCAPTGRGALARLLIRLDRRERECQVP